MDDATGFTEDAICREITEGGKRLVLWAMKVGQEKWQLSVENEHGIRSIWLEIFSTPQQAMEAGIEAIESEGIDPFASIEGFEYWHDKNV